MATIDRYYFHVCTGGARRRGVDVDAMARLVRGIWFALGDEFMGYTRWPMPLGPSPLKLRWMRRRSGWG